MNNFKIVLLALGVAVLISYAIVAINFGMDARTWDTQLRQGQLIADRSTFDQCATVVKRGRP